MENKEIIEKVLKEEEYLYNNNDEKMWIKKKLEKALAEKDKKFKEFIRLLKEEIGEKWVHKDNMTIRTIDIIDKLSNLNERDN